MGRRGKEDFIEAIHEQLMIILYAVLMAVFWFRRELGFTLKDALFIVVGIAIAFFIGKISNIVEKGITVKVESSHSNPEHSNPNNKEKREEEEVRTTGAGALIGLIAGGLIIGLPLGVGGVIAGGILGGIIGDLIERQQEREKKKIEEVRIKREISTKRCLINFGQPLYNSVFNSC